MAGNPCGSCCAGWFVWEQGVSVLRQLLMRLRPLIAQSHGFHYTHWRPLRVPLEATGLTSLHEARIPSASSLELEASLALPGPGGRTPLGLLPCWRATPAVGRGCRPRVGERTVLGQSKSPDSAVRAAWGPGRGTGSEATHRGEDFCKWGRPPCPILQSELPRGHFPADPGTSGLCCSSFFMPGVRLEDEGVEKQLGSSWGASVLES